MGGYDSELSKIVAELNRAAPSQQKAVPKGGAWQTSTSGENSRKRSRRVAICGSLYSPGVLNGVGLE